MARRALGTLVLVWAALAGPAWAAGPDTVFLEELTWTELRDRVRAGATTAIVPVGGTEQSGPHIALGKHNVRGRVLADRIARALGQALVAPTLAYVPEGQIDPPSSHMRFAGTLSIPEPVFEATLEAAAQSLRRHGFTRIVMLGEHGGYQRNLVKVQDRLNRAWAGSGVRAQAVASYYRAAQGDFAGELQRRGFTRDEIGTHAGVLDTSLTMALAPGLVRADKLTSGTPLGAAEGVYGDPRRSSADLGRTGAEIIVHRTVEAIRRGSEPAGGASLQAD